MGFWKWEEEKQYENINNIIIFLEYVFLKSQYNLGIKFAQDLKLNSSSNWL